ncbi:UNVERIFIED_CONTAM: hypothetical protein HDU68_007594, partial [Siphonaria sp. JEL0065]
IEYGGGGVADANADAGADLVLAGADAFSKKLSDDFDEFGILNVEDDEAAAAVNVKVGVVCASAAELIHVGLMKGRLLQVEAAREDIAFIGLAWAAHVAVNRNRFI